MHRQFQQVCIIEKSKWVQHEHHGSLIVDVITVSGKTAAWAKGDVIETVKSKPETRLFTRQQTVSVFVQRLWPRRKGPREAGLWRGLANRRLKMHVCDSLTIWSGLPGRVRKISVIYCLFVFTVQSSDEFLMP